MSMHVISAGVIQGLTEAVRAVRSTALKTDPSERVTMRPNTFKPTTDRKNTTLTALMPGFCQSMTTLSIGFSWQWPASHTGKSFDLSSYHCIVACASAGATQRNKNLSGLYVMAPISLLRHVRAHQCHFQAGSTQAAGPAMQYPRCPTCPRSPVPAATDF